MKRAVELALFMSDNDIKISTDKKEDANYIFECARKLHEEGNRREAAKYYKNAADKGHVGAMNMYALILGFKGKNKWGVKRNMQKAAEYYKKAADKKNAFAMCRYGLMLEEGIGVEKNEKLAAKYYKEAADKGYAEAMNNYALVLKDRGYIKSAVKYFKKAADKGNADAMYNYGLVLDNGIGGIEKNNELAAEYYKKAADNGIVGAMNNYGLMLKNGRGVKQNVELADLYIGLAEAINSEKNNDIVELKNKIKSIEESEEISNYLEELKKDNENNEENVENEIKLEPEKIDSSTSITKEEGDKIEKDPTNIPETKINNTKSEPPESKIITPAEGVETKVKIELDPSSISLQNINHSISISKEEEKKNSKKNKKHIKKGEEKEVSINKEKNNTNNNLDTDEIKTESEKKFLNDNKNKTSPDEQKEIDLPKNNKKQTHNFIPIKPISPQSNSTTNINLKQTKTITSLSKNQTILKNSKESVDLEQQNNQLKLDSQIKASNSVVKPDNLLTKKINSSLDNTKTVIDKSVTLQPNNLVNFGTFPTSSSESEEITEPEMILNLYSLYKAIGNRSYDSKNKDSEDNKKEGLIVAHLLNARGNGTDAVDGLIPTLNRLSNRFANNIEETINKDNNSEPIFISNLIYSYLDNGNFNKKNSYNFDKLTTIIENYKNNFNKVKDDKEKENILKENLKNEIGGFLDSEFIKGINGKSKDNSFLKSFYTNLENGRSYLLTEAKENNNIFSIPVNKQSNYILINENVLDNNIKNTISTVNANDIKTNKEINGKNNVENKDFEAYREAIIHTERVRNQIINTTIKDSNNCIKVKDEDIKIRINNKKDKYLIEDINFDKIDPNNIQNTNKSTVSKKYPEDFSEEYHEMIAKVDNYIDIKNFTQNRVNLSDNNSITEEQKTSLKDVYGIKDNNDIEIEVLNFDGVEVMIPSDMLDFVELNNGIGRDRGLLPAILEHMKKAAVIGGGDPSKINKLIVVKGKNLDQLNNDLENIQTKTHEEQEKIKTLVDIFCKSLGSVTNTEKKNLNGKNIQKKLGTFKKEDINGIISECLGSTIKTEILTNYCRSVNIIKY